VEFSSNISAQLRSGVHKLFRRFFDFSQFVTAINFAKTVAPSGDENKNYVVHLKEQSILKNAENCIKIDA